MSLEEFKSQLEEDTPPLSLSPLLQALWHDANGDWEKAHELAQDINSTEGSWVHASQKGRRYFKCRVLVCKGGKENAFSFVV